MPSVADADVVARVDVSGQRAARLAALRAHATQVQVHEPDAGPVVVALSNDVAMPFLDVEEYAGAAGPLVTDLFDGVSA